MLIMNVFYHSKTGLQIYDFFNRQRNKSFFYSTNTHSPLRDKSYFCRIQEVMDKGFTEKILKWYQRNKRDLPWRMTRDPYKIWLSEIILQQTRIDQGLPYYQHHLEQFPTIFDLARSSEQEVLKLWQGLGYYSRARNLHMTAKEIVTRWAGNFPDSYEKVIKLPGIGEYTAAAIASISFGEPYPVVDGNVLRFFSRYFGIRDPINTSIARKTVSRKASELIDRSDPGTFNQGIMEFGALFCKPSNPECSRCIFRKTCYANCNGLADRLPVKAKQKTRRNRYFHYLLIRLKGGDTIYLKKREDQDIWKNLFDLPLIEATRHLTWNELITTNEWESLFYRNKIKKQRISGIYKHVLTHQVLITRFYEVEITRPIIYQLLPVSMVLLKKYPLPRLIERYLHEAME